jgi:hypothetical protein
MLFWNRTRKHIQHRKKRVHIRHRLEELESYYMHTQSEGQS